MATIFQQKLDRFALLFDVEEAEHTRHFYAASKIRMEANSLFPPLAARIVSWRENNTFSFGIIEERNPNYKWEIRFSITVFEKRIPGDAAY